jgi:hypothetical protein
MAATTRRSECTAERPLYVALELGLKQWRLAITTACEEPARQYAVEAGDVGAVLRRAAERAGEQERCPCVGGRPRGRPGSAWSRPALEKERRPPLSA